MRRPSRSTAASSPTPSLINRDSGFGIWDSRGFETKRIPPNPEPRIPNPVKIEASFVRSAVAAADLPRDGAPEIALVGRSNVGKSTLINALVRTRVARTSAAPGKTRLANIYRVVRGEGAPLYLVDLPGYGYARGGAESTRGFDELTRAYFEG